MYWRVTIQPMPREHVIDWQQCSEQYAKGRTLSEIGADIGVDRETVARHLRRLGITLRPMRLAVDWNLIAERYLAGQTTTQIAADLGTHHGTVALHLKRLGVELRSSGPPPTGKNPRKHGPGPWCGTTGGYTNHGCRCDDCRAAWAAVNRRYYHARGRPARRPTTE